MCFVQYYFDFYEKAPILLSNKWLFEILVEYLFAPLLMVGVAQLVERQIVVLKVAGSSPVAHPIRLRSFRASTR